MNDNKVNEIVNESQVDENMEVKTTETPEKRVEGEHMVSFNGALFRLDSRYDYILHTTKKYIYVAKFEKRSFITNPFYDSKEAEENTADPIELEIYKRNKQGQYVLNSVERPGEED